MELRPPNAPLRSALFVDFDNIYLGLRQVSIAAAEEFGTNPGRWLAWLERQSPLVEGLTESTPQRRILLRNCYLNPRSFARYRSDFSRAAFRVVDCPPITQHGKTSTDIHMVMDILDTLQHATHFDEFILLSADADFTPVLLRLRHHDRRTVVVSVGAASQAYRNAADRLVGEVEFVPGALGGWGTGSPQGQAEPEAGEGEEAHLEEMADALVEAIRDLEEIEPGELPAVYRHHEAFRASTDWLGFWSLRGLTEALVARRPEALSIRARGTNWVLQPSIHREDAAELDGSEDSEVEGLPPDTELIAEIVATVGEAVRNSPSPVPLESLAHHVVAHVGRRVLQSRWAGMSSFKALVEAHAEGLSLVQRSPTQWLILDPVRHEVVEDAETVVGHSPLANVIRRVSRTTGVPPLEPERYAALFEALSKLLGTQEFDLNEASRELRDQLIESGNCISRSSIAFVLRGLIFADAPLDTLSANDAGSLARAWREQVRQLCAGADLHLREEEEALVDQWLGVEATND